MQLILGFFHPSVKTADTSVSRWGKKQKIIIKQGDRWMNQHHQAQ
jgi:hypothetical protein